MSADKLVEKLPDNCLLMGGPKDGEILGIEEGLAHLSFSCPPRIDEWVFGEKFYVYDLTRIGPYYVGVFASAWEGKPTNVSGILGKLLNGYKDGVELFEIFKDGLTDVQFKDIYVKKLLKEVEDLKLLITMTPVVLHETKSH